MFLHPVLKFLRIGDAGAALKFGHAFVQVGVDLQVHFLAFLDHQQFVDAIAQQVGHFRIEHVLQPRAGKILLPKLLFELLAIVIQVVARNNVPVYFADNLFDDVHPRGERRRPKQKKGKIPHE